MLRQRYTFCQRVYGTYEIVKTFDKGFIDASKFAGPAPASQCVGTSPALGTAFSVLMSEETLYWYSNTNPLVDSSTNPLVALDGPTSGEKGSKGGPNKYCNPRT